MFKLLPMMREIPGYAGYYACEDGHIWSTRNTRGATNKQLRKLKPSNNRGYFKLADWCGHSDIIVHKLVALAWHGPRPDGYDIDHVNRVKTDNRPSNLQYIPAYVNRSQHALVGSACGSSKLDESHVAVVRFLEEFAPGKISSRTLAAQMDVTKTTILRIRNRKTWNHLK